MVVGYNANQVTEEILHHAFDVLKGSKKMRVEITRKQSVELARASLYDVRVNVPDVGIRALLSYMVDRRNEHRLRLLSVSWKDNGIRPAEENFPILTKTVENLVTNWIRAIPWHDAAVLDLTRDMLARAAANRQGKQFAKEMQRKLEQQQIMKA